MKLAKSFKVAAFVLAIAGTIIGIIVGVMITGTLGFTYFAGFLGGSIAAFAITYWFGAVLEKLCEIADNTYSIAVNAKQPQAAAPAAAPTAANTAPVTPAPTPSSGKPGMVCKTCGCRNPSTAITCKDCGSYLT